MTKIDMKKRIRETVFDHYPLGKVLPQFSVFNIFQQVYEKQKDKEIFLDNHKYLKLREGYFALFACKAFDKHENKKHFMIFTEEERGDVAFYSKRLDDKFDFFQCDVKEYHIKDPQTFEEFLDSILKKPKINNNHYGLIIGTHRDAVCDVEAGNKIIDISKKLSRGIFLVSSMSGGVDDSYKSKVMYIHNGQRLIDEEFEIGNEGISNVLIFQELLNFL
jgi:hypothetical protein